MLEELIDDLIEAKSKEEREKMLRGLEKIGVDRRTALVMETARKMEKKDERRQIVGKEENH